MTFLRVDNNADVTVIFTLICVLVARPRWCSTLSNPVPGQNWMAAYLDYTLRMKTLIRGWPVMVHDTHTRRRRPGLLTLISQAYDTLWQYAHTTINEAPRLVVTGDTVNCSQTSEWIKTPLNHCGQSRWTVPNNWVLHPFSIFATRHAYFAKQRWPAVAN